MLRGFTYKEWLEWRAYMQLAPFTEERQDHRTAAIVQALWNIAIAKAGRKSKLLPLTDFIMAFGDAIVVEAGPTRKQSTKDQWAILKAIFDTGAALKKESGVHK